MNYPSLFSFSKKLYVKLAMKVKSGRKACLPEVAQALRVLDKKFDTHALSSAGLKPPHVSECIS